MDIAVRNRNYHTAVGNHMPCGITQCYLPPREVTFPPLPQPKLVLDLATPEGCKAELTWGLHYCLNVCVRVLVPVCCFIWTLVV